MHRFLTVRDPGVIKVLKLMAPRVLGLSFSEINKFIMLYMTGSMPLGSLPALNAAFRLIILPQGIIGQALGIAAFPTLSSLAARNQFDEMRTIINDSLRMLLFLGLPITVWMILLAEPIVSVLFERGLFDAESTRLVAASDADIGLGAVGAAFPGGHRAQLLCIERHIDARLGRRPAGADDGRSQHLVSRYDFCRPGLAAAWRPCAGF